jgi:purine-nucleoside phosphorylase
MSTVPEIIVARHSGIRILAMSLVTNNAVLAAGPRGDDPEIQSLSSEQLIEHLSRGKANHEEVLEAGREAANDMQVRDESLTDRVTASQLMATQELVKQILINLYTS